MSTINIQNIGFKYKNAEKEVFNGVSIHVGKGESIAIIGQNGAGKTTLVKMLNGLLIPTSGDIYIEDMNTKKYKTAILSRKVGYVFQNPDDQIFNDSVYNELAFGPKKLKKNNEDIENTVLKVAKVCGLEDKLDENPYDLPYSTRKFVAIAAILTIDPEVIILDEPTAGQDKKGMGVVKDIIDYLQQGGRTVITITHDMEFTVDNFQRVIVMSEGKKLADDRPEEIFWNLDVLKKAQLQQPYISRVAEKIGLSGNPINIKQFIEIFKEKYPI